tara:strand:+ start:36322 stop:36621 length:300 start_codon:yes stop_codon:yes gene_type:complete
MENYVTLLEAIQIKQQQGYTLNFNLMKDTIHCTELEINFSATEFFVDEFYRFEGDSNPDDMSILYVITTSKGDKGLLVDAFGVYSEALSPEILKKLKIR